MNKLRFKLGLFLQGFDDFYRAFLRWQLYLRNFDSQFLMDGRPFNIYKIYDPFWWTLQRHRYLTNVENGKTLI